jgi:DNA-binding XRE family transcriptional regulator
LLNLSSDLDKFFTNLICLRMGRKSSGFPHLGQVLREERMKQRISQREVAAALGITPAAVVFWENAKNHLPIERIASLPLSLRVPVIRAAIKALEEMI